VYLFAANGFCVTIRGARRLRHGEFFAPCLPCSAKPLTQNFEAPGGCDSFFSMSLAVLSPSPPLRASMRRSLACLLQGALRPRACPKRAPTTMKTVIEQSRRCKTLAGGAFPPWQAYRGDLWTRMATMQGIRIGSIVWHGALVQLAQRLQILPCGAAVSSSLNAVGVFASPGTMPLCGYGGGQRTLWCQPRTSVGAWALI
jgi:hypothetical protein